MSPDVLRRKLQKKAKRKPYRKCPACGGRLRCRVRYESTHTRIKGEYVLEAVCVSGYLGCGYEKRLSWSGDGIGRRIPHGGNAGSGKG